jgi:hypothetical protein
MNRYLLSSYKFGVAGGLLCGLAFWVLYLAGLEPVSFTLIFGYIITPIFVFLGIKNFRDNYNNQELFFGQGMTVGFFIYSILAAISAILVFVFLQISPELLINFREANLQLLTEKREDLIEQLNLAAYEETYASISTMTAYNVAMNDFLRKIIPGLFYTIIISIILKQSKL